ncbi:MAG: flagellar basal body L-ring protein FlgH [Rhodocyclaceae bacterium]
MALLLAVACVSDVLAASGSLVNLTADRRALKVGDLLLVQVLENSSAATTADTTTSKSGGFNVGISFPNTKKSASADIGTDFSGKGKILRSGKVLAQLSVLVTNIDEQGMLSVSGRQLIEINGDKQEIELSGRVRPEDVADDNSILSSRIADARIRYVGDGLLTEQSRPGLLTRLFSWLGLL